MTATDELRKLLEEHGIKHFDYDKGGRTQTQWAAPDGTRYFTYETYDNPSKTAKLVISWFPTPEQAIAATLGGEDKSRWHELFGTPERAARAMVDMCEGGTFDDCGGCPAALYECKLGDYDALLEWLRGDAE